MPFLIGDTASLSCTVSSIPIPGITWFRAQNGMQVQNNGDDVVIQSVMQNDTTVRSTLQLQLNNEMDFSGYFCRGNNGFTSRDSDTVQIVQACEPFSSLLLIGPLAVCSTYLYCILCALDSSHMHTHTHSRSHHHSSPTRHNCSEWRTGDLHLPFSWRSPPCPLLVTGDWLH